MTYEEFAADLTSHSCVLFNSAEESEAAVRELGVSDYELRQMGRGSSRVAMAAMETSEGFLSSRRFERSVYSPLRAPKGLVFLIATSAAGGDVSASGDIVPKGGLLVQTPETQVDFVAPDLTAADSFGIPASRFYQLVDTICPGGSSIRPGHAATLAGDPVQLSLLRHAFVDLVTHPDSDPGHERQANLIAEVVAWMGDSDFQWRPQGFSVNGARTRIARQARDYMEDHLREPIRMEDVCRELGVGLRSMQRAFASYFQVSPYVFLTKLRLDRARRALRSGDPKAHSVAAVAMDLGFSHLGRFSRAYRETFGELPSETLARRQ